MSRIYKITMTDLNGTVSFGGGGGGGGGNTPTNKEVACGVAVGVTAAMAKSPITKNPVGVAATAVAAGVAVVACM